VIWLMIMPSPAGALVLAATSWLAVAILAWQLRRCCRMVSGGIGYSTHGFRINHPFLLTEGASSTGELFLVRRIGTLGGVPHATAASIAEGCIPQASGAGVVPVHDFTSAEDFWYFTLIKAPIDQY